MDSIRKKYFEILKQREDTLVVSFFNRDTIFFKNIKYQSVEIFDEISFKRDFCFGTCPVYIVNLKRNGDAYFKGDAHVPYLGEYSTNIESKITNHIFSKFEKAFGCINKKSYSNGGTDNYSITTTIYNEGIEISSVTDNGGVGPASLVWAYVVVEDLRKSIEWEKVSDEN